MKFAILSLFIGTLAAVCGDHHHTAMALKSSNLGTAPRSSPNSSPSKKPDALLQLSARGSPYDIGYSIGFQTKNRIQSKLNSIQGLLDYVSNGQGKDQYESMLNAVKDAANQHSGGNAFADALKELEGMAAGAGVSFKSLAVINMENELSLMKSAGKVLNDHCSDVLMRKVKCNDDPIDQTYCMMIGKSC
jgi:hypothetical protein